MLLCRTPHFLGIALSLGGALSVQFDPKSQQLLSVSVSTTTKGFVLTIFSLPITKIKKPLRLSKTPIHYFRQRDGIYN
jgi:hypothetical protein